MNYKTKYVVLFIGVLLVTAAVMYLALQIPPEIEQYSVGGPAVILPQPRFDSTTSIEEALHNRRSAREYREESLTVQELSQLLWSVQGITGKWGQRTAPSAGATYPLEVYVAVGDVADMPAGVYHYLPSNHSLEKIRDGDVREQLTECALKQQWVKEAPLDFVLTADYARTTQVYGTRGERYVHMEAGHAAQNVYLQCVSLDCGMVVVGAFIDSCVKELLKLPAEQEPLYIIPVGKIDV